MLELAIATLWHRTCGSRVESKVGGLLNKTMETSRQQNTQVIVQILLAFFKQSLPSELRIKRNRNVKAVQFGKKSYMCKGRKL